jgi:uncharacterized glyoxalase superfamily protein PhnB
MPADPFDALRSPAPRLAPRRAFAVDLRRRLATALGVDPTTGETMSDVASLQPERHTVTTYICVADSRRALEWYREVLSAEVTYQPIVMDDGRVGHCEFRIGDTTIQMADEFPEIGVVAPTPGRWDMSLTVQVPDVDATFALAVERGATGDRPPVDEFYGARAGWFTDPFGHRWSVSTPLRGGPAADR